MTGPNRLILGDNLKALKALPSESVRLVYLDPPFFTQQTFSHAGATFSDSWNSMEYYISFMRDRVTELHRLLMPSGVMYLHCDWHASHYLKVMADEVFGYGNFLNSIVWDRHSANNSSGLGFSNRVDEVLYYAKSRAKAKRNKLYTPYAPEYIASMYNKDDGDGKGPYKTEGMQAPRDRGPRYSVRDHTRCWVINEAKMKALIESGEVVFSKGGEGIPRRKSYLADKKGVPLSNLWVGLNPPVSKSPNAKERLVYPTQKPLALLDRIIRSSSDEGELVLDPFCGGGTTAVAANRLGRLFITLDENPQAIEATAGRLRDEGADFETTTAAVERARCLLS